MRYLRTAAALAAVGAVAAVMAAGAQPALPGKNGKIAFSSNRDGDFDVWTVDARASTLCN